MGVKDTFGKAIVGNVGPMGFMQVSENYIAVKGSKVYDFDPTSKILKLNPEKYSYAQLFEMREVVMRGPLQGKCIELLIEGYGTRTIHNVSGVRYATPEELKIEYPQPPPTLSQIVRRATKFMYPRK